VVRFLQVTLIGLVIFTLAHLIRLIGEIVLGFFSSTTLLLAVVELAACIVVYWFYRQARQRTNQPLA